MIQPEKAAVRPRVVSPLSGETVLLEEVIDDLVSRNFLGRVLIVGPAGSGKTTALRHLAAVIPLETDLVLLDEPDAVAIAKAPAGVLQVIAAPGPSSWLAECSYQLAPWGRDEWIEYLLQVHPRRCASVVSRIGEADTLLDGIPDLWQIVLERLASDEAIPDVRTALHHYLKAHLADTDLLERARSACLNLVTAPDHIGMETLTRLAKPAFIKGLLRALRHPAMRLLLAAERVAADLNGEADCDFLALRLPRELVSAVARIIAEDTRAQEHLHALLAGPSWSHAMAASLLHAAGKTWPLKEDVPAFLKGAYLSNICWRKCSLANARLNEADLSGANLERANLHDAVVERADLRGAQLTGASLERLWASEAKLDGAILPEARAAQASFEGATLRGAVLDDAMFHLAVFSRADVSRASFRGAVLSSARFIECKIEGADFTGAGLVGACMSNLPLYKACFTDANFKGAELSGCNLEEVELPRARFARANLLGALLTGSRMPDADFRAADLRDTGLAEIDWERADLRDADLRGASFHLGSTRSGLVGSPIACEGSRTGFYTDDFEEQAYKSPEEIRKANLCGADLRGAKLDGLDFYLVDLRWAVYDPDQEAHLRRCGAILEAKV